MTELIAVPQTNQWSRLKALVLDSVSSPITKRVYNFGLDEFFAWRVALEARGLGAVSINVRITAMRKLAAEAADNGLLAPDLASGITRVKGVASKGVRLGNWLSLKQAQAPERAGYHDAEGPARPRQHRRDARLRPATIRSGGAYAQAHPAAGRTVVYRGPGW
jgi:hypothetical protein